MIWVYIVGAGLGGVHPVLFIIVVRWGCSSSRWNSGDDLCHHRLLCGGLSRLV